MADSRVLQPWSTLQGLFALYRRTCLDQGSVVVFADEFNPAKPDHISVPSFDMSNIMVRPLPVTTEVTQTSYHGLFFMMGC